MMDRAPVEIEAVDILDRLKPCDPFLPVPDFGVARNGSYARVAKVFHQLPDCLLRKQRIGVDGHQDFVPRRTDGHIQRSRFAAVGFREDAHARLPEGDLLQEIPRAILRAVVHHHHFQFRVVGGE